MSAIKFALKHYVIFALLASFGVITYNGFWHKPVEKKNMVVVSQAFAVTPVVAKKKVVILSPDKMAPAQRACYLRTVSERIENACKQVGEDLTIYIVEPYWENEKEVTYRFINKCYVNKKVAISIGSSLHGTKMDFSQFNDEPLVSAGAVTFPATDMWTDPENVLNYLNTPPE